MREVVRLPRALLVLYAACVAAVTVLPSGRHGGIPRWAAIHWVPFVVDAASFVLNIEMFVPFGVLVPLVFRSADAFRRLAVVAGASSAGIEAWQFVLGVTVGSRRTVDVNDLIANTVGAVVGLAILRLAVPSPVHRDRFRSGRPSMTAPPAPAGTGSRPRRRRQ
jgi:glycopeptide antibiotics resistance protein